MTFAMPPGISPPLAVSVPILEPILEQLLRERDEATPPHIAAASEGEPSTVEAGLRSSSLGCHASWYRENLSHCSEAMLQYEWAWMNGRLAALRHCRASEGSELAACPPEPRLDGLLSESQLFRTLLLQEFASRGLRPLPPRGTVVASEEAWEITSASVRQEWGIEP